ncbi:MAG: hypothetical protein HY791_30685 [Deltaproteobacteria bacterium]|nr:hypothetical protein [Deltaproteobacteria bacterium]
MSLGVVLLAAIAIEISDREDVEPAEVEQICVAVERSLVGLGHEFCRAPCVSTDGLALELLGSPTLIRLSLQRTSVGTATTADVDRSKLAPRIDRMVRSLFPEPSKVSSSPDFPVGPVLFLGGGVGLAVAGSVFGVISRSAVSDLSGADPADDARIRSLTSDATSTAHTANVLFAVATTSAVAGLVWLLFE